MGCTQSNSSTLEERIITTGPCRVLVERERERGRDCLLVLTVYEVSVALLAVEEALSIDQEY